MRASLIFLILCIVCTEFALVSLGVWQFHRWQQRVQEQENRAHSTRLSVTGIYQTSLTVALDNQPHPTQPDLIGWRLLTPLQTVSTVVIVDRGWLPLPPDRTATPTFAGLNPPAGSVKVTGIPLPVSPRKGWLKGPDTTTSNRVLARLNPALITPQGSSTTTVLQSIVPDNPRLLAMPSPTPNPLRHLSYMIQWLTMAALFPVLCLALLHKRMRNRTKAAIFGE